MIRVVALLCLLAPSVPVRAAAAEGLADGVMRRIVVAPEAAGARETVAKAVSRLVEGPTGRALAEEFVAEAGTVTVFLETRTPPLGPAVTEVSEAIPTISIDPAAPDFQWNLAHELLGHSLRYYEAEKAGVDMAYAFYSGNEFEASLVGWLIAAEAGAPRGRAAKEYLEDPVFYRDRLECTSELYAAAVPFADIGTPLPLFKQRKARCARFARRVEKVLKARLSASDRADYERSLAAIGRMSEFLDRLVRHFSSADGEAQTRTMRRQAYSESGRAFFAAAERRIDRLKKRFLAVARTPR